MTVPVLIALLVCLIPTTIGGLLSAIGIAGMDRMIQQNVIAMSGRSVEAAGDVNTLLLDKTGTITLGNRQAVEFIPIPGVALERLADRAQFASLPDETPEGRSIVVLAKERFNLRGRAVGHDTQPQDAEFVPFSAVTRMSGVNQGALHVRKGASDAVVRWVTENNGTAPGDLKPIVDRVAREGGTPLVVAEREDGGARVLGVIYLKDVVKGGIRERFDRLRAMGIRTVMITGDNPLTAAAIAHEAGVDDFLAEATPEDKITLIRREQAGGKLVAMTGDGTNDAPALAQADVGVAMNSGTQAAKEAGNMIDLDSNPTKLIEVVEIGKQLLMTRGCAHHLLDRERRGEVLRDHPGDVRRRVPGARRAQRDASAFAGVGDPGERDLQRAHHHRAHPAGTARREIPSRAGRRDPAPEPAALRRGRGADPLRRHQAHRHAPRGRPPRRVIK